MPTKKHVLMVISSNLCKAGQPNVVMKITKHLSDQYVFDALVLSDEPGYYDQEFLSYGGKIFRMRALKFETHKIFGTLRGIQIRSKVKQLLAQTKYDIVHSHIGYESGIVMRTAAQASVPARITHAHGTYINTGKNILRRAYFAKCQKSILRFSNGRVACANVAGETLFPGHDYINVLNPVDTAYYSKVIPKKHEGIRLLQIGYYAKEKNQLFSVELIKRLSQINENSHLTFIGFVQDQAYYEKVMRSIAFNGLGNHIEMLPYDTDQIEQLAVADFVLLPSTTEGLPLVSLESQIAGVPCLMSDRIGVDADLGLSHFIKHDSLEQWVDCIFNVSKSKLKLNTKKAARVSESGFVQRIMDIYGNCCQHSSVY